MVTDLVAPTTLRTFCASTSLAPAVVASIGQQLAATLRYLHDNDVVHRAVTADRIFIDVAAPVALSALAGRLAVGPGRVTDGGAPGT